MNISSSKLAKIKAFNPNGVGLTNAGIFGLPFSVEESNLIVIPVPWELTTSYGHGTSLGPEAILKASTQIDLYHPDFPTLWKEGIAYTTLPKHISQLGLEYSSKARDYIEAIEKGEHPDTNARLHKSLTQINEVCEQTNNWVYNQSKDLLLKDKKLVILGGDHSTPFGYLKALKKHYGSFGILHIDAHMDLRTAYEGFTYSHASIMYNVIQELDINQVTQVGIRDFCKEENHFAHEKGIHVFDDSHLKKALFEGETWKSIVNNIIQTLPNLVYISFDIDGLNPELCPNTGTPVPGGLSFEQSMYLIEQLAKSGKRIIGADLVEVTPSEDEWDANVGARVLYHLLGYMHLSNLK